MELTKTGLAAVLSAVGFLLAGWLANYPELVVLGVACAAALVVALVWMKLVPPDVAATRDIHPVRPAEGATITVVLSVTNKKTRRSSPLVLAEHIGERVVPVPIPSLAGTETRRLSYEIEVGRRGRYALAAPTIG